jgi:hypothetical protein
MNFKYNDGGRSKYFKGSCGDCAIRAIAIASGLDYLDVYNMVKAEAGKSCRNGTPKKVGRKILARLGFTWVPTMTIGSGCKVHLTANEVPKNCIVSLSKHLCCIKDGVINDTYDPSRGGNRCVYGYFIKNF